MTVPTFGVEEEFMLVDRDGRLSNASAAVLADAPPADGELQRELVRCQVESASPVCSGADELLKHLQTQRDQLAKAAERHGLRLLPIGIAPHDSSPPRLTADARYEEMSEHFGGLLDGANICGCHVHVAVPDPATGLQVGNHLRPWLPLLLAVSANSPFTAGKDSGYASWRHQSLSLWPTAGPPPYLESLAHYRETVASMRQTEAIMDEQMIYWDMRLSTRHPTLEIRVCDVVPTAEEATLLAVLVRALTVRALRDITDGRLAAPVASETIRAGLWRAGRDGLAGQCPAPDGELVPALVLLERLVHELDPVLQPGEREFARSRVDVLRRTGDPASRQRAAFARRERLGDVIDLLAGRPRP
jgi:carboxylate-amine ligase